MSFLTNGPWCVYTVLHGWPHNMSALSALFMVERWDSACFSVWYSAIHWFHSCMTVDGCHTVWWEIPRKSTLSIGNDLTSIDFRHLLVCISSYYDIYNTIFRINSNLTKRFPNEKSATQLFFHAMFQMLFFSPASSRCPEILITCISRFLKFFRWFPSCDCNFNGRQCKSETLLSKIKNLKHMLQILN